MEENELISEEDMMMEFLRITNQDLAPGEITVNLFVEMAEVSRNRARYILYKYELEGYLKSRSIVIDGKVVNAYSPAIGNGTWAEIVEAVKSKE